MNTKPQSAIPSNIRDVVNARWPDSGPQWCGRVGDEFRELCARYDATPIAVMQARYGFVVKVNTPSSPLVLKATPDPDGVQQARAAVALGELSIAPKVHETMVTDTGTWIVMDCVVPGTPWGDLPTDTALIDALGVTLGALRETPPPAAGMPLIHDWLRGRLEDDALTELAPGRDVAPLPQRREALSMLAQLGADGADGLCHGDLSTRNVLREKSGRLFLVDPRGFGGDIAYDVAVAALKATSRGAPRSVASHLADSTGVDPDRVRAWMIVADRARV